mmetsp:Transcript_14336/g.29666  ORF Transcript_14336/g.29666 Transcript_14336/m.29666 type:complete len:81 (-) Transcript_14336:61-303(-)
MASTGLVFANRGSPTTALPCPTTPQAKQRMQHTMKEVMPLIINRRRVYDKEDSSHSRSIRIFFRAGHLPNEEKGYLLLLI